MAQNYKSGVQAHTCDPRTQETEVESSRAQGQPWLHKTLSQTNKNFKVTDIICNDQEFRNPQENTSKPDPSMNKINYIP